MNLKCGVHAEPESETRPIFVCHHCGMPVCEEHGWVVVADDAFHDVEEPMSRSAMHCPECAAEYHPRGVSKRRGWVVKQRPYPQPQLPYRTQPYPGQQSSPQPSSAPQQQPPPAP